MKQITKQFWICFLLIGATLPVMAQSPKFIVYFASGKCSKVVAGKASLLKKGDKLGSADMVKIGAGGKAILICSNFNTVQLNTAKDYKVTDLYNKTIKEPASFTASYFHFVWDEFSHPHSSPEKEPEKYMKTAGAVTRGKEPVDIILQTDTIRYCMGPLALKYSPKGDSVDFVLYKVEGKKLNLVNSSRMAGTIDLTDKAPRAGVYQWQLSDINNPKMKGAMHTLLVLAGSTYELDVEALLKTVVPAGAAETAFMKGFLMEQHRYLAEAAKYYREAARLQPANKTYVQMANRF